MMPREVQKVLAARGRDAFDEFKDAVRAGDRDRARRALDVLREAFEDEEAAIEEWLS